MITAASKLAPLGIQLNPKYIADEFAETWGKDPTKLFVQVPVNQNINPTETEGTTPPVENPIVKKPEIPINKVDTKQI